MRKILLSSLVMAALAATPAAAQTTGGLVTPFIGVVTGTPIDENRTVYGGSIGATGSVVGFEFDFGYSPNFYEVEDDFGELGSSGSVIDPDGQPADRRCRSAGCVRTGRSAPG